MACPVSLSLLGTRAKAQEHEEIKERAKDAPDWGSMVAFEEDAVRTSGLQGPTYKFSAVAGIVRELHICVWHWVVLAAP